MSKKEKKKKTSDEYYPNDGEGNLLTSKEKV